MKIPLLFNIMNIDIMTINNPNSNENNFTVINQS